MTASLALDHILRYRQPPAVGGTYTAQGVAFNNSPYLTGTTNTPFTGAVAGDTALVSFWFKMQGTDATFQILFETGSFTGLTMQRYNDNTWYVAATTSGAAQVFTAKSSTAFAAGSGWHHVLVARNTASVPMMYIDDVSDITTAGSSAGNADYAAAATMSIGARGAGSLLVNADIADLYIGYNQFLDISNVTNRRKFISASLRPVDLGSDGSTPTGTAPLGYFSGAAATWHVNKGSGGNLFTVTGTLSASSTNP